MFKTSVNARPHGPFNVLFLGTLTEYPHKPKICAADSLIFEVVTAKRTVAGEGLCPHYTWTGDWPEGHFTRGHLTGGTCPAGGGGNRPPSHSLPLWWCCTAVWSAFSELRKSM